MPNIDRSVGSNAVNDDGDVTIVQRLLNAVPVAEGGANPILDIDGWCGTSTISAISRFQAAQLKGFKDGNVSPGHDTIKLLNDKATGAGARPVPDPDPDPATVARHDAQQASIWGMSGLAAIKGLITHVQKTGGVAGFDAIVETALAAHFRITSATTKAEALLLLGVIRTNFTGNLMELGGGLHFRSVGRREMRADFGNGRVKSAPGYTFRGRICWSPLFHARRESKPGYDWMGLGFGPRCRAAMVLHEPIHLVDPRADFDTYEWGPDYANLTADRAAHNASSYPSFAAHVAERSTLPLGPRYGVGRELE